MKVQFFHVKKTLYLDLRTHKAHLALYSTITVMYCSMSTYRTKLCVKISIFGWDQVWYLEFIARDDQIHEVAAWHLRIRSFWCAQHAKGTWWVCLRPLLYCMSFGRKLLSLWPKHANKQKRYQRRRHRYLPRLPGTSLKRVRGRNMFNYPLSKFASQDGSLNFPREAEIHFFRRDFTLIYQSRP